jgi:hypothetical protein
LPPHKFNKPFKQKTKKQQKSGFEKREEKKNNQRGDFCPRSKDDQINAAALPSEVNVGWLVGRWEGMKLESIKVLLNGNGPFGIG